MTKRKLADIREDLNTVKNDLSFCEDKEDRIALLAKRVELNEEMTSIYM